jgi:hypothetical protein
MLMHSDENEAERLRQKWAAERNIILKVEETKMQIVIEGKWLEERVSAKVRQMERQREEANRTALLAQTDAEERNEEGLRKQLGEFVKDANVWFSGGRAHFKFKGIEYAAYLEQGQM